MLQYYTNVPIRVQDLLIWHKLHHLADYRFSHCSSTHNSAETCIAMYSLLYDLSEPSMGLSHNRLLKKQWYQSVKSTGWGYEAYPSCELWETTCDVQPHKSFTSCLSHFQNLPWEVNQALNHQKDYRSHLRTPPQAAPNVLKNLDHHPQSLVTRFFSSMLAS